MLLGFISFSPTYRFFAASSGEFTLINPESLIVHKLKAGPENQSEK